MYCFNVYTYYTYVYANVRDYGDTEDGRVKLDSQCGEEAGRESTIPCHSFQCF